MNCLIQANEPNQRFDQYKFTMFTYNGDIQELINQTPSYFIIMEIK